MEMVGEREREGGNERKGREGGREGHLNKY